ncbi:MAG: phosphotransferase [Acidimicrobiales bacterium]
MPPLLFTDAGDPPEVPPLFASALVAGECQEPLLEASSRERLPEAQSRARAFSAVRMLAALHRVDPATIGLGDEEGHPDRRGRPLDPHLRHRPDEVRTGYQACAEALRATAPEPLPAVVVHGDYRLGNMLPAGDDVLAIIDWEIWSRSDPAST